MAHIADIGDGRYRISMCVDRQRASKVVKAKSLKAAERLAVLMEENLRETGSIDKLGAKELRKLNFRELANMYLTWQTEERSKKIRPKTHQKYKDILEYQLGPFFNTMRVTTITEKDINEFLNYMRTPEARFNKSKKKRYSDGTIKDAFTLLQGILKYAVVRLHIIAVNPCDCVDKPTIEDRGEMVYYDDKQLSDLLKVIDADATAKLAEIEAKAATGRYQPFTLQKEKIQVLYRKASVYIAVYTAARRGEVLGIHRQDINFEEKTVHFCHNVIYTKADGILMESTLKSVNENTIGINDELADILRNLIDELDVLFEVSGGVIPYTDRLFMGLNKTKLHEPGGLPYPDPYSEWFKLLLERYNLPPMTFHKLRHSSISYMLHNGVKPDVVRKIAGHSTMEQIEKTYGHVYKSKVNDAAFVFDKIKEDKSDGQEVESSSSEATGSGD